MNKHRFALALLTLAPGLQGCGDHFDRREGIASTAGDAARANMVTHIIDPWPPQASSRRIHQSAGRLVGVIERYEAKPSAAAPVSSGVSLPTSGEKR